MVGAITAKNIKAFKVISEKERKKMKMVFQLAELSLCKDHALKIEELITGESSSWGPEISDSENIVNKIKSVRRR